MKSLVTIFFFCSLVAKSQNVDFQVLDTVISVRKNETQIVANLAIRNNSDSSIVLFNLLGKIVPSFMAEKMLCDRRRVDAGIEIFILKDSMILSPENGDIPIHENEFSFDSLSNDIKRYSVLFDKNSKTIDKEKLFRFKSKISLTKYNLAQGTYYFYLVYYSGQQSVYFISEMTKTKIRKNHDFIFQGCLRSNFVKLIIN